MINLTKIHYQIPAFACILSILLWMSPQFAHAEQPKTCTYNTWSWNTVKKRSEGHRRVKKAYSEITAVEIDKSSGCTVCEEDQAWIKLKGIRKFRVCQKFKDDIETALKTILDSDFPLYEVTAYRVGKSKGPVDENGLRTQFSNHSFGTAIDINRSRNGLYNNCFSFGPKCKLSLGGAWDPARPGTLTEDSVPVQAFKAMNWKWGGQIKGRQKDFMHFSPSGY